MLSVYLFMISVFFFFSSRRRHTRCSRDWSSDVCSSDLGTVAERAWRYTTTHRCPYVLYVWDLPPWRIGSGKPDPVWWAFGRFVRLPRLDRKSTRLNSSHGYISYAVFCLKKKKS